MGVAGLPCSRDPTELLFASIERVVTLLMMLHRHGEHSCRSNPVNVCLFMIQAEDI